MDGFLQSLCFFCAVTAGPHPQVSQVSRPDWDIRYTHERVGGRHLLRLSTTDFIIDQDQWRRERLQTFAEQFAKDTCRGRYRLEAADRASWPRMHTIYAKQYVFRCV